MARPSLGKPRLHQRTRGRQHEIRQADAAQQHQQNGERGTARRRFGRRLQPLDRTFTHCHQQGYDGHQATGNRQHGAVDFDLFFNREKMVQAMRIRVAAQQQALEKKQAGGPHAGRATKPRQDVFANERLHQEQQEGTPEYGDGKGQYAPAGGGLVFRISHWVAACE